MVKEEKKCVHCGETEGKFVKNSSSCEDCRREYHRKYYHKRKAAGCKQEYIPKQQAVASWYKRRVTIDWCPRDEWPRMRYFSAGQFSSMLEDGILTPGMRVTQHDKQYVVWGPKGEQQWLKAAVDKRGRTL